MTVSKCLFFCTIVILLFALKIQNIAVIILLIVISRFCNTSILAYLLLVYILANTACYTGNSVCLSHNLFRFHIQAMPNAAQYDVSRSKNT